MTEEEALAGFPISTRERKALDELCGEGARLPKGVATQTRQNLLARGWIRQTGVDEQYFPIFVTTQQGLTALQIDDVAAKRGLRRPLPASSMARQGSYEKLVERLQFLRGG